MNVYMSVEGHDRSRGQSCSGDNYSILLWVHTGLVAGVGSRSRLTVASGALSVNSHMCSFRD